MNFFTPTYLKGNPNSYLCRPESPLFCKFYVPRSMSFDSWGGDGGGGGAKWSYIVNIYIVQNHLYFHSSVMKTLFPNLIDQKVLYQNC